MKNAGGAAPLGLPTKEISPRKKSAQIVTGNSRNYNSFSFDGISMDSSENGAVKVRTPAEELQQLRIEMRRVVQRNDMLEQQLSDVMKHVREVTSRRALEQDSFRKILATNKIDNDTKLVKQSLKLKDRDELLNDWTNAVIASGLTEENKLLGDLVLRTSALIPKTRKVVRKQKIARHQEDEEDDGPEEEEEERGGDGNNDKQQGSNNMDDMIRSYNGDLNSDILENFKLVEGDNEDDDEEPFFSGDEERNIYLKRAIALTKGGGTKKGAAKNSRKVTGKKKRRRRAGKRTSGENNRRGGGSASERDNSGNDEDDDNGEDDDDDDEPGDENQRFGGRSIPLDGSMDYMMDDVTNDFSDMVAYAGGVVAPGAVRPDANRSYEGYHRNLSSSSDAAGPTERAELLEMLLAEQRQRVPQQQQQNQHYQQNSTYPSDKDDFIVRTADFHAANDHDLPPLGSSSTHAAEEAAIRASIDLQSTRPNHYSSITADAAAGGSGNGTSSKHTQGRGGQGNSVSFEESERVVPELGGSLASTISTGGTTGPQQGAVTGSYHNDEYKEASDIDKLISKISQNVTSLSIEDNTSENPLPEDIKDEISGASYGISDGSISSDEDITSNRNNQNISENKKNSSPIKKKTRKIKTSNGIISGGTMRPSDDRLLKEISMNMKHVEGLLEQTSTALDDKSQDSIDDTIPSIADPSSTSNTNRSHNQRSSSKKNRNNLKDDSKTSSNKGDRNTGNNSARGSSKTSSSNSHMNSNNIKNQVDYVPPSYSATANGYSGAGEPSASGSSTSSRPTASSLYDTPTVTTTGGNSTRLPAAGMSTGNGSQGNKLPTGSSSTVSSPPPMNNTAMSPASLGTGTGLLQYTSSDAAAVYRGEKRIGAAGHSGAVSAVKGGISSNASTGTSNSIPSVSSMTHSAASHTSTGGAGGNKTKLAALNTNNNNAYDKQPNDMDTFNNFAITSPASPVGKVRYTAEQTMALLASLGDSGSIAIEQDDDPPLQTGYSGSSTMHGGDGITTGGKPIRVGDGGAIGTRSGMPYVTPTAVANKHSKKSTEGKSGSPNKNKSHSNQSNSHASPHSMGIDKASKSSVHAASANKEYSSLFDSDYSISAGSVASKKAGDGVRKPARVKKDDTDDRNLKLGGELDSDYGSLFDSMGSM